MTTVENLHVRRRELLEQLEKAVLPEREKIEAQIRRIETALSFLEPPSSEKAGPRQVPGDPKST
jgi:hypothetical protein